VRIGENAILVRDRAATVERVLALIAEIDRPKRRFRIQATVVRAGGGEDLMVSGGRLPEELLDRLRRHLRFETYLLEASGVAEPEEDTDVDLVIGSRFRTSFTVRTTAQEDRVRLEGFRLFRSGSSAGALVHTHVNLEIGKPMILGLARNVRSRQALMVVLHCIDLELPGDTL
jgi:hypothetical protein